MKIFLKKLYKLDIFSKLIVTLILFLVGYLFYFYLLNSNIKSNKNSLLEVSSKKTITLNTYFFERHQINRYADDKRLFIKINEKITQEDLKKLEFRILPNQEIEASLLAEDLIEIKFKESSPADLKENVLIVLDSGKQLFRISYRNISVQDSRADYIDVDRTE